MNGLNTDIVVIGAGPIGLFTAFQAGLLNMKVLIIDSLDYIGGQCAALYPEKPIYDIPAYPEIMAQELIEKLAKQAEPFKPQYLLSNTAERVDYLEDESLWSVVTDKGVKVLCKAIIIAGGQGKFTPNRPELDNIDAYEESNSIAYSVDNKDSFKDKDIVIVGGGDSAVDWSLNLVDIAKSITLVHRRAKFKAVDSNILKLKELQEQKRLNLCIPYQIHGVNGSNNQLSQAVVKKLGSEEVLSLPADKLLFFFGLRSDLTPFKNWGLNLENNDNVLSGIKVDELMKTNVKNIYAVGDIASYPHKLKLILTGFSEVAIACHDIYNIVFPNKRLKFEYSTSKTIP